MMTMTTTMMMMIVKRREWRGSLRSPTPPSPTHSPRVPLLPRSAKISKLRNVNKKCWRITEQLIFVSFFIYFSLHTKAMAPLSIYWSQALSRRRALPVLTWLWLTDMEGSEALWELQKKQLQKHNWGLGTEANWQIQRQRQTQIHKYKTNTRRKDKHTWLTDNGKKLR